MLAGFRVPADDEMLNGILAVYGVSRGTHVPGGVVVGKGRKKVWSGMYGAGRLGPGGGLFRGGGSN